MRDNNPLATPPSAAASTSAALAAATPIPAAPRRAATGLALAALAGLVLGALAAYWLAAQQFDSQAGLIAQAADLRVQAAEQRTREVEQQLHQVVQQADAQRHDIVEQAQQQELALLERAKEREQKLALPDLPLRVWVRPSPPGRRIIVRVHNFGTGELPLSLVARRTGNKDQGKWQFSLAPNATQDLGADPEWAFADGDELALQTVGFRPSSVTVRPVAPPPPPAKQAAKH